MLQFIYSHPKWQSIIKPSLKSITQGTSQQQIRDYLNLFSRISDQETSDQPNKPKLEKAANYQFKTLFTVCGNQTSSIFSEIAKYILQCQANRTKLNIPIFFAHKAQQHSFKKSEIVLLLSLMTMNLIPIQQFHIKDQFGVQFHQRRDFRNIFCWSEYKTKTIIEYLIKQTKNREQHDQKLTINRLVTSQQIKDIVQKRKDYPMTPVRVADNKSSIEDQEYAGHIKIDFANAYIGGGSLSSGLVQQEIMFANHPQLYTTMLLCQKMKGNQALAFTGFRKYFNNTGYSKSTKYDGPCNLRYDFDPMKRVKQYIVAIDAVHFSGSRNSSDDQSQFSQKMINRQLLKAYTGFSFGNSNMNVITGNWGCGVFRGTPGLKFMIQWVAASMNKKQMVYCPFGSLFIKRALLDKIQQQNVGSFYPILLKTSKTLNQSPGTFLERLEQHL